MGNQINKPVRVRVLKNCRIHKTHCEKGTFAMMPYNEALVLQSAEGSVVIEELSPSCERLPVEYRKPSLMQRWFG